MGSMVMVRVGVVVVGVAEQEKGKSDKFESCLSKGSALMKLRWFDYCNCSMAIVVVRR